MVAKQIHAGDRSKPVEQAFRAGENAAKPREAIAEPVPKGKAPIEQRSNWVASRPTCFGRSKV